MHNRQPIPTGGISCRAGWALAVCVWYDEQSFQHGWRVGSRIELRPWALGAVAHHEAGLARAAAQRALYLYDATPAALRHTLHPDARRMLDPARRLRRELEAFVAGAGLCELSARARRHIAKYRFICLSERIVEAGHKDVKMRGGHRKISGTTVSMALRASTVMERRVRHDPSEIHELLEQITEARRIRQACRYLICSGHPWVVRLRHLAAQRCYPQTTLWDRVVAHVLYRCDIASMFAEHQKAGASHKKQSDREDRTFHRFIKQQEKSW